MRRRDAKDAEIEAARAALEELEADSTPSTDEVIRMQLPAIRDALALYALATEPQDKRRILKTVVARVEYKKTVRCYRNQDPSKELELVVTPVSPVG